MQNADILLREILSTQQTLTKLFEQLVLAQAPAAIAPTQAATPATDPTPPATPIVTLESVVAQVRQKVTTPEAREALRDYLAAQGVARVSELPAEQLEAFAAWVGAL